MPPATPIFDCDWTLRSDPTRRGRSLYVEFEASPCGVVLDEHGGPPGVIYFDFKATVANAIPPEPPFVMATSGGTYYLDDLADFRDRLQSLYDGRDAEPATLCSFDGGTKLSLNKLDPVHAWFLASVAFDYNRYEKPKPGKRSFKPSSELNDFAALEVSFEIGPDSMLSALDGLGKLLRDINAHRR